MNSTYKNNENRDCRGMCLHTNTHAYNLDDCGYCRLTDSYTRNSPCDSKCSSPISVQNEPVCGQCLNDTTLSDIINECGTCRAKDTSGCSCEKYHVIQFCYFNAILMSFELLFSCKNYKNHKNYK